MSSLYKSNVFFSFIMFSSICSIIQSINKLDSFSLLNFTKSLTFPPSYFVSMDVFFLVIVQQEKIAQFHSFYWEEEKLCLTQSDFFSDFSWGLVLSFFPGNFRITIVYCVLKNCYYLAFKTTWKKPKKIRPKFYSTSSTK